MSHQHGHGHGDLSEMYTAEFWDERYGSAERVWSGNPNPTLVTTGAELAPGSALDVGCGEGADAIWLASHGWRVTGLDVSTVALQRAARHAEQAGDAIAGRITWQQTDIRTWEPAAQRFDLVAAHFIHLPGPELPAFYRRIGAAVAPGGTLLVVGHHPSDMQTSVGRPHLADLMFTAEEIAAFLDPADWHSVTVGAPERPTVDPDGQTITIRDAVVRAVRPR